MWCPNCKSEYRDGITECNKCHTPLVAKLPIEVDTSLLEEKLALLRRMDTQQNMDLLSDGNHTYVEKSKKYEDVKSTAYSFLFVSIAGILFLVLIYTGIIPIQFATYMKYLMAIVMGGMFLIFFIVGIRSYQSLGDLKSQVLQEQQDLEAAKNWFFQQYSAKAIDITTDIRESDELQQKYYLRSYFMKGVLMEKFPAFKDDFLDYLTDLFYEELYEHEES